MGEVDLCVVALTLVVAVLCTFLLARKSSDNKERDTTPAANDDEIPTLEQADTHGETPLHVAVTYRGITESAMARRSQDFRRLMNMRRSVRFYDTKVPPLSVIEECVRTAGTAPSGAHCQPWRFVIVKGDAEKATIRKCVEGEEQKNY